jgi:hypothetical protein
MRVSSLILAAVVSVALFLGCGASCRRAASEPPALVIHQLPDYPQPGRGSKFPGGLVAALWRDGRLVRATSASVVGKSYVEGVITTQECEEFFRLLTTAKTRAPKIDLIPLHVAIQSITVRSEGRTTEWIRILPDTDSVWGGIQSQLLSLPLRRSHVVDSAKAKSLR